MSMPMPIPMPDLSSLLACALALPSLLLALPALLLLVQVLLACTRPRALPLAPRPGRIAVLVPAHNEGPGLLPTLAQARAQLQPTDTLLVVADNCSDDTADLARAAGAEVTERRHASLRGKGYALDHGVRHLAERIRACQMSPPDVLVVLDADCTLGPGLLPRIASVALASGRPVQARYLMHAANTGLKARVAAFALRVKNWVRPRGMQVLGVPCGLYGTGMAFPWSVAKAAPLASGHLAEDMQLGVRLAQLGAAPLFCEDAHVTSTFAGSREGAHSQRTRWEHGHLALLVGEGPGLLWQALRQGRVRQTLQVLDLLVPPLALLMTLNLAWAGALALLVGVWPPAAWAAAIAASGLLALGLAIVLAQARFASDLLRLPELLLAPVYLLAKLPLYLRFVVKRQVEWVRTKRDA
jgi:glycosyltransferase involved in cell wall biosynthesis